MQKQLQHKDFLSWAIAFAPILGIYETGIIPALSIIQIILLLYICKHIANKGRLKSVFSPFVVYGSFITVINFFRSSVNVGQSLFELFAFILFFLQLAIILEKGQYHSVRHYLNYLGYPCLAFFFIQYLLHKVGINVIGVIPGLPLSNGSSPESFRQSHLLLDRLSSFFQEPAHYAEFMSLFLALHLFDRTQSKHTFLMAGFISMSIILCQSAGGYMLLLACWAYWGFCKTKTRMGRIIIAASLPIVIIGLVFLSQLDMVSGVIERYTSLSLEPEDSAYGYSSYNRLFRGYIPIIESPLLLKIFGNGIGTLLSFVAANPNSNYLLFTDYDPNWINSFQLIIFSFGFVGGLLFFKPMVRVFVKNSDLGKCLLLIYLLALLSSGILLTASSLLFLFIIFSEYQLANNQRL